MPVQPLVAETYRLLWARRDDLVRLGLVPTFASFLLAVLAGGPPSIASIMLVWLINLLPLTMFTVNWYRLSLLGPAGAVPGLGLSWDGRKTRFLLVNVLLFLGIGAVLAIPAMIVGSLFQQSLPGYAATMAVLLIGLYLWLRLGLVLPAITVDYPYRMTQSWSDTAGYGFAYLGAALAAVLPIVIAQQIFFAVVMGTGLIDAAPYAVAFLGSIPTYLWSAAAATLVALVFRRLTGWPGSGVGTLREQSTT